MRELSLFTGAGGGLLASHLLGWSPIGYVEFNDYCQRVIAQRIADGFLPVAPIFGDVREFVQSGAAREYRGFVDVVTGGFPCQPFSIAGRRKGAGDERNMWPATLEVIRQVRPRYAFLENVRGLLSSGYFQEILKGLAESGYDARWRVLSAADVGAPHRRERLWIVAHTNSAGQQKQRCRVANETQQSAVECSGTNMGNATGEGLEGATGQSLQGRVNGPASTGWWEAEPGVGRVVDGLASRVDRLKSLGNGQVPLVAATAWRLLVDEC